MNIGLGIGIPFTRSSLWASIFTPSALFLDGSTQGVWYDPSDINLTWRRNLLTYSEQFDNAVWTKAATLVTPNSTVAPDGTLTADTLTSTGASGYIFPSSGIFANAAGATFTYSVYVKADTSSTYTLLCTSATNYTATYNLNTGVTSGVSANAQASVISAGNGWFRLILTLNNVPSQAYTEFQNGRLANGTSVHIWGAQLELGSTVTPYQRITDGIQDYLQYQPLPVLYRDAAGTVPVTAVEQPVGLMLDKSKGLVLGPELVTNGDFSSGSTGWTLGANTAVSGGTLNTSSGASASTTAATVNNGAWYKITFTITSITTAGAGVRVRLGGTASGTFRSAVGTYTEYLPASAVGTVIVVDVGQGTFVGSIDNISVRELPGNHAFNPSGNSANFPVLSARYNLLTKTEDFSDAVWGKTGINAFGSGSVANTTATTDPLGGSTSDLIQENSATSSHDVVYGSAANLVPGSAVVISVYVKQAGRTRVTLGAYGAGPVAFRGFDLQSISSFAMGGSLVDPTAYSIVDAGNGWRKISVTYTATSSAAIAIQLLMISTGSTYNYTGDGTSGIYLWGADLRVTNDGSNLPSYQRVNTATDYDTVGFKPYLKFNGTNQWLQTNSIDFTATDKMTVFAGVRKLSDAATGLLTEFSASTATNAGSFFVALPIASTASYRFESKGTVISSASSLFAAYPAPITNVLTGIGDISGDQAILRVNGVQAASSTADQGTGNFGNYPLYIGARAGSSLWFNGRLYGMVIVGKQASSNEIQDTEKYMNLKTAAYN